MGQRRCVKYNQNSHTYLNMDTPFRMIAIVLAVLLRSVVPPPANIIG